MKLAAMNERDDKEIVLRERRDQMLKLVSKGFYNELINYGVRKEEILRVASHLLDNLLAQGNQPGVGIEYYNQLFTIDLVKDEWREHKQLAIAPVILRPLQPAVITRVV